MSDVLLELGADGADLVLEGDDLARDEGLKTAVLISICSDARADGGPRATTLQPEIRGWWADSIRDRFGSRLWTLEREKRTTETLERARELGRDALAWLISDQIASRIEVEARFDELGHLKLDVEIHRGDATRQAALWEGTTAVRVEVHQPAPSVPVIPPPDQNVVLFTFDDGGSEWFEWSGMLAPDVGYAFTPRMNEMRARGVTFRRASVTPICCTTRACIHTGRWSFRNGIGGNFDGVESHHFGMGDYGGVQTELGIAQALRLGRDGTLDQTIGLNAFTYVSAWFGKAHLFSDAGLEGYPIAHGWGRYIGCQPNVASLDHWPVGQDHPNNPGDPGYVAQPPNSGHFHFREIEHSYQSTIGVEMYGLGGTWPAGGPYVAWDPTTTPRAAWDSFKVYRDAISWINTRTKPFFAKVCLTPPHAPIEVPPYTYPDIFGHGATGATRDLIRPETQATMTSLNGGAGGPGFEPTLPVRVREVFRANIEAIDTLIGLFWDRMEPTRRDRTVFIFVGDNGTVANAVAAPYEVGHAKRTLFEQGVRVPMFVWGSTEVLKNLGPSGRFCDHLVHAVDIFPTALEIMGCNRNLWNPNEEITIDGRSFLPVLLSSGAPPARDFLYNELFSPLGAKRDSSVDPPIPSIVSWARSWSNGTHKLISFPTGVTPPYRMFRVDSAPQPASGQPGYLELNDDDLYPLAADGMHPDETALFNSLLAAMNAVSQS